MVVRSVAGAATFLSACSVTAVVIWSDRAAAVENLDTGRPGLLTTGTSTLGSCFATMSSSLSDSDSDSDSESSAVMDEESSSGVVFSV